MGFLPKDYVSVSTRIEQAHEKHGKELSIETEFDIKDKTVIFTAKVKIKSSDQVFTGHSFGEAGKEKAFEKLETVAVGRALAFAGFETREGIASREEMEVFEEKKVKTVDTPNGGTKPKAISSKDESCPSCGFVNKDIKKGTTKEGRSYEKCDCEDCGTTYFINR